MPIKKYKSGAKPKPVGRKPLPPSLKKMSLVIFPTEEVVENVGGEEQAKLIAVTSLNKAAKKK